MLAGVIQSIHVHCLRSQGACCDEVQGTRGPPRVVCRGQWGPVVTKPAVQMMLKVEHMPSAREVDEQENKENHFTKPNVSRKNKPGETLQTPVTRWKRERQLRPSLRIWAKPSIPTTWAGDSIVQKVLQQAVPERDELVVPEIRTQGGS